MPKWSEMLARLIPWLDTNDDDGQQLHAAAAAVSQEQTDLAPYIDAQTDYLVRKGAINGFTAQLHAGFARRATGE